MRKLFCLLLTGLLAAIVGCDDNPDYPIIPYIEFDELRFEVTPDPSEYDELILTIKFRDGDNDLGVDYDQTSMPYHYFNFFLAKNGELQPVSTWTGVTNEGTPRIFSPIILPEEGQSGKLATIKTKSEPGYDFMPENIFPYNCLNYWSTDAYVYIKESDSWMIDESYNIVDTIDDVTPSLLKISEKFYSERNENAYNIFIDFLLQQPDGSFQELDFETQYCTSFDGRFPNTSKFHNGTLEKGPFIVKKSSKWKGQITYYIRSSGFTSLFGGKKLKLRVNIKDRALHDSNVIETDVIQF